MPLNSTDCDHAFQYQGQITWPADYPRPGSGARDRVYADAYYCTRCCGIVLRNEQTMDDTYTKVRNGATEYTRKPETLK